ncbi:GAF domain-containing protein [Sphingomonas bacterium]|uniref:GAF domain-containing protein n=1 Tax=Sphingomonas bacterium TaxID=1895847 RepID=UPI001575252B|nr:GAF domain-containing protein [Sphingomonas bacterium]
MATQGYELAHDAARLATLDDYAILDTPSETGFDDIVRLATLACDAPTALVSMIADDRQWFKARSGFAELETDLATSVCAYTITADDLLVIPDLALDPRTVDNRLVTNAPHARFYAGAPLRVADGQVLGALCVIDLAPRPEGLTLDQAETLRALAGQVVALLELRRALTQQVSREAHWRGLFEQLSEGFVVKDAVRDAWGRIVDWRYVEVNAAWCDMLGMMGTPMTGRTLLSVFPTIEQAWIEDFAAVVETGEPRTFRREIATLGRWYEGRAFRLGPDRFAATFVEVTDQVRHQRRQAALLTLGDRLRDLGSIAAMTVEASRVVGEALCVTRVGFGRFDAAQDHLDVSPGWTAPGQREISGSRPIAHYGDVAADLIGGQPLVIEDVRADPRTAGTSAALETIGVRAQVNMPVRDKGRTVALLFVHDDKPRAWTAEELSFLRSVADRLEVGVARLQADERQKLLNEELSHRLKNTLSIVQAIATQTLKSVADRPAVEILERRLMALGAAHDLLLRKNWVGADLRQIAEDVIGAVAPLDRMTFAGASVEFGSRAAMSLSLLLHELATNAIKYGSLSRDGGIVTLAWQTEQGDHGAELVLSWVERGGPPATQPIRRGFGSKLIRMGLIGTGGVDARYDDVGFSAVMRAPLMELQSA